MRTLPLTVSSGLSDRCETYPSEIFAIWKFERESALLTLYDQTSWRFYVDFLGENKLGFSFRIMDGFLHEFHNAEVFFSGGEWRAGPILYPKPSHCE